MRFHEDSGRLWVKSECGKKWHLVYDVDEYWVTTLCGNYPCKSGSVFHTDPPVEDRCKSCLRIAEKETWWKEEEDEKAL